MVLEKFLKNMKKFDKVMLYREIVCMPMSEFENLNKNRLDIINMMEENNLSSYCQVIELFNGKVLFDTLVLNKTSITKKDIIQFLQKLSYLKKDCEIIENEMADELNCEVVSKITSIDVVTEIGDDIRRYKAEEFISIISLE